MVRQIAIIQTPVKGKSCRILPEPHVVRVPQVAAAAAGCSDGRGRLPFFERLVQIRPRSDRLWREAADPGCPRRGRYRRQTRRGSDDIFGDGVNIASRLEGLAVPGGLCISDDTFRQVRAKLDLSFEDGGYQNLKNIAEPVRVWRCGGPSATGASKDGRVSAGIMREGPSVAVLPFNNMSSDPEQEYFADGVVEDVITALARYPSLFVVARNSSFAYKGKSPDIRVVGRDLGVRYVLEGSIRRATGRLRITAQLIEAETGRHLWADKYEGNFDDVFDLQDRIVSSVVGTIEPQIGEAEIARALKRSSNNLSAYELVLRSKFAFRKMTTSGLDDAVALAEKALNVDPSFAAAAVAAANARGYRVASGRSTDNEADIEGCLTNCRKALELDPLNVEALAMAGRSFACFGEHQLGLERRTDRSRRCRRHDCGGTSSTLGTADLSAWPYI